MERYAMGLDFGTNSCRSLIVNLGSGREVASHVFDYPSGDRGILISDRDPNLARQNPADYLAGLEAVMVQAIVKARDAEHGFEPERIIGIGVDTTGSTPIPVDRDGTPLALTPRFRDNPDAAAWLWKDHTSHAEARLITMRARDVRPHYLATCGGTYSSEWFWSKIWHCLRQSPDVYKAAYSFVELCDWIPAVLGAAGDPRTWRRSACAAGHKALFARTWGGLPDATFLAALDPALAGLRERLFTTVFTSDIRAYGLSASWAARTGMRQGTAVAVGGLDAHMGAVGAGCAEGVLVKILGTSACDLMVAERGGHVCGIPGVCGIAEGSVLPGYFGIEAGQSAVGDLFLWFVTHLTPACYGDTPDEKFAKLNREAARLSPGQSGLLALDWNNGNRCVLADPRLTGLVLGQTLQTSAAEVYRALIEATAFGSRMILDRVREYGVAVRRIRVCGGLAVKNPFLMRIYADVLETPLEVAASDQTCALGAALYGAVAAGGFPDAAAAQTAVCRPARTCYEPQAAHRSRYGQLFALYKRLHDAFGQPGVTVSLHDVMKELISIRETCG